ncbi:MAG TPA: pyruvate ferredoxin oxidoreductase [Candidatus Omnitrophica bacterium]|nr:MAG: pyruvate ferredoxin oxidoreductase [Candidatus Omnitrophota bacterium]RKY45030.1 MAG: pyruvate ferredoxin oxidoreductase [Candidatus Omnitrophota bacterium]HEC69457.1 pyruvate ferredoxin oxidoreductase [Candidatus Omnitrophota bacterium]
MKKFLEGSQAVAKAVKLAKPGVISAYPITPQTHIVEGLAQFVADGELKSEFVNVESEHSAASAVLGAEACGVRSFTATSSQGLILMSEVLFNIAGMRLPVMLVCANRALSAPINIWNDHQDSIALRDSGWIQFYAENHQEVVDFILQGYKIGENPKIMLPVMVCMDGYILTHGMEVVDIPSQEQVDKFLPPYNPPYKLDIDNPLSLGLLGDPTVYMETRYAIQDTLNNDVLKLIPQVSSEFESIFGRRTLKLVETYKTEDAEVILVAMGSVAGTIKDVIDEERSKGKKVGLLKIVTYRPFPKEEVFNILKQASRVGVIEKAISLGSDGPLYTEISALFSGEKNSPQISGFIAGLGGRDITEKTIQTVIELVKGKKTSCIFMDLNKELLWEDFRVI